MARVLAQVAGQFQPLFPRVRSVKLLFLINISSVGVKNLVVIKKY